MNFSLWDFIYPVQIVVLKRKLSITEKYSHTKLVELQNEQLQKLINYVYLHVPYYKELFDINKINPEKIRTIKDLSYIPVLTKQNLRENFAALTCDKENFKKNRPSVYHTSGSTGTPVKLYHDKYTNISKFVFFWRMWGWAGYSACKATALIGASFANDKQLFFYNKSNRILYISIFKINCENSLKILDALIKYKCEILRGYPSSIYNFLRFIIDSPQKDLLNIKMVISQAENLFDFQRQFIEDNLKARVFNCYSQWEHVCLAMECERGSIHHQMENGVLEILDNKNDILDNGKLGEITATGFYNRTMPLIRYKTGDLAVKKGIDCRCGRQHDIIERLDGRVEEVVMTSDNRYVSALNNAVKYASGMDYVQILQREKSFIDVRIVKNKSFKNKNLMDLEN